MPVPTVVAYASAVASYTALVVDTCSGSVTPGWYGWRTFLYAAPGIAIDGDIQEVTTPACTTVLAGFETASAVVDACLGGSLQATLADTELVELCGAFGHEHVAALRNARPGLPVGLVSHAGDMTNQLHRLYA